MLHSRPIRSAPCIRARTLLLDPRRHTCRTGGGDNCSIVHSPGQSQARARRAEIYECGEEWSQTNVFQRPPTSLTIRCLGIAMNTRLPTYAYSNQQKAFHSPQSPHRDAGSLCADERPLLTSISKGRSCPCRLSGCVKHKHGDKCGRAKVVPCCKNRIREGRDVKATVASRGCAATSVRSRQPGP